MEGREDDKKGGAAAGSSAPGSRFKNLVSREYYSHKKKVPPRRPPTLVLSRHKLNLFLMRKPKIPREKKPKLSNAESFLDAKHAKK
jgi:hypothetical protein